MAGTEAFPRLAYEGWQLVTKNSWIIGDFTWTGMDHIGESSLGYPSLVPIPHGGGPARAVQQRHQVAQRWEVPRRAEAEVDSPKPAFRGSTTFPEM